MVSSAWLERANYENDHRVRAAYRTRRYTVVEGRQSLTVKLSEATVESLLQDVDETDEAVAAFDRRIAEIERTSVVEMRVCSICRGRGRMVNPSIDCGGLTREDFDDPDFAEDYRAGRYNVTCSGCGGLRVVPEWVNMPAEIVALEGDDAEYAAMCAAERRMGA